MSNLWYADDKTLLAADEEETPALKCTSKQLDLHISVIKTKLMTGH